MRVVVCVKYVPVLAKLSFDPVTRRLVRTGVPGEPSAFDVRALVHALALREKHGGEVVVVTMGPPEARDGLVECLALGADRGLHLCDAALAGSDTLATARALAAALRLEVPDLVLLGRVSVDAETGQVGPELAELLDLPQVTSVHRLELDADDGTFRAERETDDGFETVEGPLPAVITAAEDLAEERFPSKAEREAAAAKPIETLGLADLKLAPTDVGEAGSPTWVAGVEECPSARRGEMIEAASPEEAAQKLGGWLAAHGATAEIVAPALPPPSHGDGPPIWVVVEAGARGMQQVTAELLAKAAALAGPLGARVEAVMIGGDVDALAGPLAAAGADHILVARDAGLTPYTTDAHAAVLADAIRARAPRLVLLAATIRGRDLAPRVAARLGLGLTGDAIDVELDAEGRVRQMKPAFGGIIVAPILSHTRPEIATVRPGMLPMAAPDPSRRATIEELPAATGTSRTRVVKVKPLRDESDALLDAAELVIGVGKGIGSVDALQPIRDLAHRLGASLATTREVTDAGWLPRQLQIGLTGRAISPRLYVALAIRGSMEHVVGLRRAGIIVAINKSPKAPIFKNADVGIVADYTTILPHLEAALTAR